MPALMNLLFLFYLILILKEHNELVIPVYWTNY